MYFMFDSSRVMVVVLFPNTVVVVVAFAFPVTVGLSSNEVSSSERATLAERGIKDESNIEFSISPSKGFLGSC